MSDVSETKPRINWFKYFSIFMTVIVALLLLMIVVIQDDMEANYQELKENYASNVQSIIDFNDDLEELNERVTTLEGINKKNKIELTKTFRDTVYGNLALIENQLSSIQMKMKKISK